MNNFNNSLHTMTLSEDGSYTAYSKEYNEHYHSTKDGALHESLVKHVIPAFKCIQDKKEITILDICLGLGFNTLATLHYIQKNNLDVKVNIFSPELDADLVQSLENFTYPSEFDGYKEIIASLVKSAKYEDKRVKIEVFLGDAREYIKRFEKDRFDVVYQDAFSPSANPILWTREYFKDIKKIIKEDGILTTYSIALATRLALYENDFNVYLNEGEDFRKATVASLGILNGFKEVDMQHKISCNPDAKSLKD